MVATATTSQAHLHGRAALVRISTPVDPGCGRAPPPPARPGPGSPRQPAWLSAAARAAACWEAGPPPSITHTRSPGTMPWCDQQAADRARRDHAGAIVVGEQQRSSRSRRSRRPRRGVRGSGPGARASRPRAAASPSSGKKPMAVERSHSRAPAAVAAVARAAASAGPWRGSASRRAAGGAAPRRRARCRLPRRAAASAAASPAGPPPTTRTSTSIRSAGVPPGLRCRAGSVAIGQLCRAPTAGGPPC